MDTYSTLHTKETREKWGKCFNDAYVQPTRGKRNSTLYNEYNYIMNVYFSNIQQLDKSLHEATQQLLNDKKEG